MFVSVSVTLDGCVRVLYFPGTFDLRYYMFLSLFRMSITLVLVLLISLEACVAYTMQKKHIVYRVYSVIFQFRAHLLFHFTPNALYLFILKCYKQYLL